MLGFSAAASVSLKYGQILAGTWHLGQPWEEVLFVGPGKPFRYALSTILAPWTHLEIPWERQEGHVWGRRRSFIDFETLGSEN